MFALELFNCMKPPAKSSSTLSTSVIAVGLSCQAFIGASGADLVSPPQSPQKSADSNEGVSIREQEVDRQVKAMENARLLTQPSRSLNTFGFAARFGFNIDASFKDRPIRNVGSPTGLAENRVYDNGFIGVDVSGNAGGLTWFWGYQAAAQISAGGTALTFQSSTSPLDGLIKDASGDPAGGFELTYARELGGNNKWSWGIASAVGGTELRIRDGRTLFGNVVQTTDTYPTGFIPPPPSAPGTFAGPGPLIPGGPVVLPLPIPVPLDGTGLTTTRTEATLPGSLAGQRQIEASVYGFRLGPYFTRNLTEKLSLSLGGGLAIGLVHSDLNVNETLTVGGTFARQVTGTSTRSDVLVGGYVEGRVTCQLHDGISVFTGVQYQNVGVFSQTIAGKQADLDLSKSIFLVLGLSLSF